MKTRITAILLAALMLMSSLVACGGKTETPEATTAAQNENIDGDNTTTTPAETEPPAPTVEDLLGFKQTDYNQYEFHMYLSFLQVEYRNGVLVHGYRSAIHNAKRI